MNSGSMTHDVGLIPPVRARAMPAAWMMRRLLSRIEHGTLTIVTPGGTRFTSQSIGPGPNAMLVLHRWRTLRRLLLEGDVGFGLSYVDGDWSSPDIATLVELAGRNDRSLAVDADGTWAARLAHRMAHRLRANTRTGSRRNIMRHYDLGNAFYARWLDRGLTYSSALYSRPDMTLEEAQEEKQDRVLSLLDVRPGQEVLEIGIGWGGMAERLAVLGARVTGVTLSPAQLEYAQRRMEAAGLAAGVDLSLRDYRDCDGRFDRLVSIEMLEAVGEAFWPVYFRTLRDRLTRTGIAVLQVITIADERFDTYRNVPDFIQRYIFPGGMLPSPSVLRRHIAEAGLAVHKVETFGDSYARTVAEWRTRFIDAWPDIAAMGFSERFRRLWEYYLCYCEGGFRAGAIDVGLWQLGRTT